MYPVTGFGRGVAVFLMLTGITLFGLLTASVASFFVEDDTAKQDHLSLNLLLEKNQQLETQLNQLVETQQPRKRFHLRATVGSSQNVKQYGKIRNQSVVE